MPSAVTSNVAGVLEHGLLFTFGEIEEHDRTLGLGGPGPRLALIEQLAFDRLKARVVPRRRRQHDGARLEAVEIDVHVLDFDRLLAAAGRRAFTAGSLSGSGLFASSFFGSSFFGSSFFALDSASLRACSGD